MHLIEGYVNHIGPLLQLKAFKFKDPFTHLNSKVSSTMNSTLMHLHKAPLLQCATTQGVQDSEK